MSYNLSSFISIYKTLCRIVLYVWYSICIYCNIYVLSKYTNRKYPKFSFRVFTKSQRTYARVGKIDTPHGTIITPAFIFCCTKGICKSTTIYDINRNKSQIILANTYHLYLKGWDMIQSIGGLHKALGWNKPIFTDSGGYQIFAMNHHSISNDIKGRKNKKHWQPTLSKVDTNGALFRSYYDKSKIKLTPEKSIAIQQVLGADLMVSFDECTSYKNDYEGTKHSMHLSHEWETRSLNYFSQHNNHKQALYGIIQGGIYKDLRKESCQYVMNKEFFGTCIGGCLGETTEEMYSVTEYTMNTLREIMNYKYNRPTHLLGIGYICDIFHGVEHGIDTFDCVHPTRISRRGFAYIPACQQCSVHEITHQTTNLGKRKYQNIHKPIMINCGCTTCKYGKGYTCSYLHTMIKAKELMVYTLITNHNIYFINKLFQDIRYGIMIDNLDKIKNIYIFK